jgi:glycosyltransferase involved in cell wall biosynthesis
MPQHQRARARLTPSSSRRIGSVPRPTPRGQNAVHARRRILFVANDAPFFVSHRVPLALAAQEAGYDVIVAAPPHDIAGPALSAAGLARVEYRLTRSGTSPIEEVRSIVALGRLYRALRPDVVHHVAMKPALYGSIAARLAGVPCVVNAFTGLGTLFVNPTMRGAVARRLFLSAYGIAILGPRRRTIFQNEDDRALFLEARAVRLGQTVIIRGSGVDLAQFRPTPEPDGPPLVVVPSRMLRDKGIVEFVEAAAVLRSSGVVARFALIGDGDDGNPSSISAHQLHQWAASGVVEWWGHRRDMMNVLRQSSIVCLPSYREGLPKSLIEAAAAGRAMVATDVPGCRDVVQDGVTGLLVPVRDSHALAVALRRLIESPDLRAAMSRESRRLAESTFGLDRVLSATLALYDELCAELPTRT